MTGPSRRSRRPSPLAAAVLLLAACAPAPSGTPSAVPSAPPASPAPTLATPGPSASGLALAAALRGAIDPGAIVDDLRRLEVITRENGGTRAAGTDGDAAATVFVADELRALGYDVTLHELTVPLFSELGPGRLEIDVPHGPGLVGGVDFKPVLFSPSGDVTAEVAAVGFDPAAAPGTEHGLGCDATDWDGFPVGAIALVQPGSCLARTVVEHAQVAGALGLVRSYPGWTAGRVLRPTLLDPRGITIPVIGATHAAGLALNDAAAEGHLVHLVTETTVAYLPSASVVAETPDGDPSRVLMLGAHLDGVIDGPGINDNGSGAMTILEIARRLAAVADDPGAAPAWKVRFAFWTAEEIGLWASLRYVAELDPAARSSIRAYLNFDMLGSLHGVRQVYDGGATGPAGSVAIRDLFGEAFEVEDLAWQPTAPGGSDHLPFEQAGIPIGGLFAGRNSLKTASQVELFGGTLDELLDPCYHLPCDTLDNVDPELLGQMARAAAWVVGHLASGEVDLDRPAL